jgi:hypothetical protein
VDVQHRAATSVAVVVLEQVLAVGLGRDEPPAVEDRGAVGEAALRAAGRDDRPAEQSLLVAGEAVQGVAFGHAANVQADVGRDGHTGGHE